MGSTLIVIAVPDEYLTYAALHIEDGNGNPQRIPGLVGWPYEKTRLPDEKIEEILSEHPDAFWVLKVPREAAWKPPREPKRFGPRIREAFTKLVAQSMQRFINGRLAQLDVRTGSWMLDRARVSARVR